MIRRNGVWIMVSLVLACCLIGVFQAPAENGEGTRVFPTAAIQSLLFGSTPAAVTFAATSDNRGTVGFSDVLNEIKRVSTKTPEMMVSVGDLDPPAVTRSQLDAAFGVGFRWIPVVGNHETDTSEDMVYLRTYYQQHLEGRVLPGPAGSQETTYSFDLGPIHMVVINEYFDGESDVGADGDIGPELLEWLADDLSATDNVWKVVFGHEPAFPRPDETYGSSRHVGDSLDAYPESRDNFWQLLESHNVLAYVCGHTHGFSRYRPPDSPVWQIDAGQAREIGEYDTFLLFMADNESFRIDIYRSFSQPQFSLYDTMALSPPGEARRPASTAATGP